MIYLYYQKKGKVLSMGVELKVLELENQIQEQRVKLVDDYLLNSDINPKLCTLDDKMAIYSMLTIKAKKYKQNYS